MKPAFLISCFFLSFAVASGQIAYPAQQDKWELSLFAGWGLLTGSDNFVTPVDDGGSSIVTANYDGGYVFGLRVTENLGQRFGADLEYSVSDRATTLDYPQSSVPRLRIDQRIHTLSYVGVFYLKDRRSSFRPYGLLGAGASLFSVSSDSGTGAVLLGVDLKSRWKLAASFGGGMKWLFDDRWGLRFDVRDNITGVPDYGLPRSVALSGGTVEPALRPNGNLHNLQFSAGILYRFSGR